jgi:hypothetical protein
VLFLIIAGIIAINTNIEDTKNIKLREDRNLFAIVSSSSSLLYYRIIILSQDFIIIAGFTGLLKYRYYLW